MSAGGFCNYLSGLGTTLSGLGQAAERVSARIDGSLQNVALNLEQVIRDNLRATPPDRPVESHRADGGGRSPDSPAAAEAFFMGSGGLTGEASSSEAIMSCDHCGGKFSFRNRKKQCKECQSQFCSVCCPKIPTSKDRACLRCSVLLRQPPVRDDLMELRVKDLQRYLVARRVNTKSCVEKKDLVELVMRQSVGGTVDSRAPPVERQRSFPKSYVESTHRHDWLERFQDGEEDGVELVEEDGFVVIPDVPSSVAQVPQEEDVVVPAAEGPGDGRVSPPSSADPADLVPVRQEEEGGAAGAAAASETREPSLLNPDMAAVASSVSPSSPRKFAQQGLVYLSEIQTLEQLSELSVKQMKEILAVNRVNFKGVMEKDELLKIVERLWKTEQKLMEGKDTLEDSELCKICMDSPVDCVMLECGHMCTCIGCGKQMNECPICRQYVVRVVKIFKS